MNPSFGSLVGLAFALSVLLLFTGLRRNRRPRLLTRLQRYQGTASAVGPSSFRALLGLVLPNWGPFRQPSSSASDSPQSTTTANALRAKLARAGKSTDLDRFRFERLAWIGFGVAGGLMLAIILMARSGDLSLILIVLLMGVGAVIGFLLHDRSLVRATRKRAERMSEQLPTVAELLAFAVAAGETPLAAFGRVERSVGGDLGQEFKFVVDDVRSGTGFLTALRELSQRSPSSTVSRFIDGVIVSTERGTPMAEVLRAQAADARAASRRQLMEGASKKESLMIAPVVFLVLPMLVVIALYPGVYGLSFTVP